MRMPVPYRLDDGAEILIEVDEPAAEPGYGMRAATPLVDRLADQAERSLQTALDTVTRTARRRTRLPLRPLGHAGDLRPRRGRADGAPKHAPPG